MTKIKTLNQLKKMSSNQICECFISFGVARSSKDISYDQGTWHVFNYIDDTEETFASDGELEILSNIVEAIQAGALFAEL